MVDLFAELRTDPNFDPNVIQDVTQISPPQECRRQVLVNLSR
jgi:hypothetical protein